MSILLGGPRPAGAQRTMYTNFNSWYTLNGDIGFTDRWAYVFDVSVRRSGPLAHPAAMFTRNSLAYALSPGVRVFAGFTLAENYPFGKIPNPYAYPERRLWEMLQLSHSAGRIAFTHRYRLEQRWLGLRGADTTDHAVERWERLNRFRYLLRSTMPLHGDTVSVHGLYLMASDEIFVAWGKNVQSNVFDQNRASAAIGWRLASDWRLEVGYLNQLVLKPDGHEVENDNTLITALSYNRAPHARK